MSDKGYVIMNVPKDCIQCEWSMYRAIRSSGICCLDKECRNILCIQDSKPEWCPIRAFPGEQNHMDEYDDWERGYCAGYNVCLDDIKGE